VRAQEGLGGGARGIGSDSEPESGSDGGGRRSRQAGPPWQRDREGEGALGRNGPGAGKRAGGERAGEEFSGPRREKKKGRMGWAERVRGKKKRFFHFPKRFKHFQIKFKLKDLNLR